MLVPFPAPRIEHLAAPIIASLIIALVVTIPVLHHTLTLSLQHYNTPNRITIPVATALYCYSLDLDLFCQLPGNTCRPHRSSNKLRSIQLLLNSPATRQPTGYILVNITGGCTAYTTHSMITEEQTTKVNPVFQFL